MKPTEPTRPTEPRIWTSSFRAAGREPNAVAIARGLPSWFRGRVFDPLRPTRAMLGLRPAEFDRQYASMLMRLDPHDVAEQLAGSILLCWEPQRFDVRSGVALCHRYTVAQFLAGPDGAPLPEWTERDRMQLTFAL